MPPPVRHEVLAIYEEEDSQFEAPQGVSSNEEPPIEMTYRSMMSCSIEPAKSLPPNPMVELDKKKDIVVEKSTFRSQKGKERKSKAEKAQGIENEQEQARKQEDNGIFSNWRQLKRCPKILHHNIPLLTRDLYSITCPLHM